MPKVRVTGCSCEIMTLKRQSTGTTGRPRPTAGRVQLFGRRERRIRPLWQPKVPPSPRGARRGGFAICGPRRRSSPTKRPEISHRGIRPDPQTCFKMKSRLAVVPKGSFPRERAPRLEKTLLLFLIFHSVWPRGRARGPKKKIWFWRQLNAAPQRNVPKRARGGAGPGE